MNAADLLWAELRRDLRLRWTYRFNAIGWFALWLVMIPLTMLIFDQVVGGYSWQRQYESVVGFFVWSLCIMGILAGIVGGIGTEAREGTLESYFLSGRSPLRLISTRLFAQTGTQTLESLALALLIMFVLQLQPTMTAPAVVILVITLIGVFGLALGLAGLTLVYKQIDGVISLISLVALALTGALAPINGLGVGFAALRWLVPTAWSIDALRRTLVYGTSWSELGADGVWAGLMIQALAYVILGLVVFRWGLTRVRRDGSLGAY